MSNVEDVLNSIQDQDVICADMDVQYLIDNELRIIEVPQNGVILGVEGDKDVNTVRFKMPRMYRGLDLGSGFSIRINYANSKNELGYFSVINFDINDDFIVFEWLLGPHVLKYVGEIVFSVSLIKTSFDGVIKNRFNTTLGKAQCLTGLSVDVNVPDEEMHDLITQIKNDVINAIGPSLDTNVSGNVLKGDSYGTIANIQDVWPSPILNTKVLGQSNQVKTTGKNLMRLINDSTINGVSIISNGDGSYYISGSQTKAFTRFYTDDGVKKPLSDFGLKAGDTVYLSATEAQAKLYTAVFYFNSEGSAIYTQTATSSNVTKYTIPENVTQIYGCISLDGNVGTSVNSDFHPMISLSNNNEWESYTGGKPSPSPEYPQEITNLNKAEIVISGKNLFSFEKLEYANSFGATAEQVNNSVEVAYTSGYGRVLYYLKNEWKNQTLTLKVSIKTTVGGQLEIQASNKKTYYNTTYIAGANNDKAITFNTGNYEWLIIYFYANKTASTEHGKTIYSDIQLEVGSIATNYKHYLEPKYTPIDLKGNALCSLPKGIKDEIVIDTEGSVSLIKRTKQHDWNCVQIIKGSGVNYAIEKIADIGANYTELLAEKAINAVGDNIGICYVNQKMIYVVVPESVSTPEQANQLYGGMKVIYQLANPEIIPLGKVEPPALQESTSNVWNNGNIPANVYVRYLRDVTLAYNILENQIKQMIKIMEASTLEEPVL